MQGPRTRLQQRRSCMRVLLLALALAGASGLVHAQGYPSRPITLIIPTAVGGGNDTLGRVVADRMSPILGQQIVPENRGGAGGTLATKQLANSPPDGYTLGISNSGTMGMGRRCIPLPATIRARISRRSAALPRARSFWWSARTCRRAPSRS